MVLQTRWLVPNVLLTSGLLALSLVWTHFPTLWIAVPAMLVAGPLVASVFVYTAARADQRRLFSQRTKREFFALVGRLCLTGLVGWALTLFLFAAGAAAFIWMAAFMSEVGLIAPVAQPHSGSGSVQKPSLLLPIFLFLVLPLAVHIMQGLVPRFCSWFLVPLIMIAGLPALDAYRLGRNAEMINYHATTKAVVLTVVALSAVFVSGGVLAFVVLPFVGAYQYVAYRDVFLGQAENEPSDVRVIQMDESRVGGVAPEPPGG